MSETGKGAGDWRLSDDEVQDGERHAGWGYARGVRNAEDRMAPLVEAAEALVYVLGDGDLVDAVRAELARLRARP